MFKKWIARIVGRFFSKDILAGKIRHILTSAGGLLIGYQLATVEEATTIIEAIMGVVNKQEFWEGILLYATGFGGSVVNKVKAKK